VSNYGPLLAFLILNKRKSKKKKIEQIGIFGISSSSFFSSISHTPLSFVLRRRRRRRIRIRGIPSMGLY